MKAIIIFLSLIISLAIISCDTNEPPTNSIITLKLEDVSCIEAWIKLETINLQLPATVTIKRNNQTRSTISLVKPDTILFIDSLLPNQTYQYQISSIQHPASSIE